MKKIEIWACYWPWNPESLETYLPVLLRQGYDVSLHPRLREPVPITYIAEAAPNKMFSEEQRERVRFLRFEKAVPCCECGKRRKTHWTSRAPFRALTMATIVPIDSGRIHIGIAPVCRDHLLADDNPLYVEDEEEDEDLSSTAAK
ncbi:MAG TPA: hypothetical protein VK789_28190 [Bryobacteraceae bacterium]|jgi:hypothetical protein|nr:hypothetical protein [Bryobacteraceae bacterium]